MKVKDLLSQGIDIDVYDDVCEALGIAFCGPVKLTEAGLKKFADVLEYEVSLKNDDVAIVHVDDEDGVWQKKLKKAKEFFDSMAGICSCDEYDLWFEE